MSIQLIKRDKFSGQLIINEGALEVIKNINENISICLIAGPYRQGKSFLLNRLISNSKNTFEVTDSDEACTRGIWINKDPVSVTTDGKTFKVIFMDTEGIDGDSSWDLKLLLLSLSISSIFLYNTKDALTKDAFRMFSILENYSNLKKKSNLKIDPPMFVWIIRDYTLGKKLKAKERLDKFLEKEIESNIPDKELYEIRERNKIRDLVKNLFQSINCFYLGIPQHSHEKNLTQTLSALKDLNFDLLTKNFIDEFETIQHFLFNNIFPKEINNQAINGKEFSKFLKNLVKTINLNEDDYLKKKFSNTIETIPETLSKSQIHSNLSTNLNDYLINKDSKFNYLQNNENINEIYDKLEKSNLIGDLNDGIHHDFHLFKNAQTSTETLENNFNESRGVKLNKSKQMRIGKTDERKSEISENLGSIKNLNNRKKLSEPDDFEDYWLKFIEESDLNNDVNEINDEDNCNLKYQQNESNKLVECNICKENGIEKFFKNNHGLSIHKGKMHKQKKGNVLKKNSDKNNDDDYDD